MEYLRLKKKLKKLLLNEMYLIYFIQRYVKLLMKNKFALKKVKRSFKKVNTKINTVKKTKNDTVFILGSGASINNISEQKWKEIKQSDTIGFNFWPIHKFVPTYFTFELPRDSKRRIQLVDILKYRKESYKDVKIILKDYSQQKEKNLKAFGTIIDEICVLNDIDITPSNKSELVKALKYNRFFMQKFNIKSGKKISRIPKIRASVSFNIFLAYQLGYKNIILCGVDLNNTEYFYEEKMYQNSRVPIPPTEQTGIIHKTNDPTHGKVTITMAVEAINNYVLKPDGIKLYIESKDSALYPMLPYYWESNK